MTYKRTQLFSPMGAIAVPRTGGTFQAPVAALLVKTFKEPRAVIGPFNFPVGGGKIRLQRNWFLSWRGKATQKFVGIHLGNAVAKFGGYCPGGGGVYPGMPGMGFGTSAIPSLLSVCYKNYPSGSSGNEGFSVNKWMPLGIWKGIIPLIKTKNPETGVTWGIYFEFKKTEIIVTLKKVPPSSWFVRLLKGLIEVVMIIIKSVGALFDFLGKIACAIMKPAMQAAAAYVGGAIPETGPPPFKPPQMSAEEYSNIKAGWLQLQKAKVKTSDLQKLRASASNTLATQIANNVSREFCGGQDITAPPGSGTNWMLIGLLGLGGAALYFRGK